MSSPSRPRPALRDAAVRRGLRPRPFASVSDLYRRTAVEKDALENLIHAGFLDALSPAGGRPALLAEMSRLPPKRRWRGGQEELPHPSAGWEGASGIGPAMVRLPTLAASAEREQRTVLGLDVVRHPLAPLRRPVEDLGVTPAPQVRDLPHGARARAAGIMECLQRPPTRSGRPVWFLLIEDESGLLQCTVFEHAYRRCGHVLYQTGAYLLEGSVEQDRRRGFSYVVDRIADLGEALISSAARAETSSTQAPRERTPASRRRAG